MELISNLLGLGAEHLAPLQMAVRAFVLFFTALLLIRIAGIRTLGKHSSFDVLTSLMLGSLLGRTIITGPSFFGPVLASVIIVLLHRLVAWITFKSRKAGRFLKGKNRILMKDGVPNEENLSKELITREDILEAVRHDLNASSLRSVKEVHLERSGDISVVERTDEENE